MPTVLSVNDTPGTGGGAGTGTGWDGEVANFSSLPAAASVSGQIYMVLAAEGVFIINRKQKGLYRSDGTTWTRMGDNTQFFNDTNFKVANLADPTKGFKFNMASIATAFTRTWTVPDKDDTFAGLSDNLGAFGQTTLAELNSVISDATLGGAGAVWSVVTVSQNMASGFYGYITNSGSLVTLTLPTTSSVGDIVVVSAHTSGGWSIAQGASQIIFVGNLSTTVGAGGSLASTLIGDTIELTCVVANTTWRAVDMQGNITVT